jgi:hypothetical protein
MRYLMIQFIRKPNGQIDEHVQVSKKVKKSDESTKNVILDYGTREVTKCVIEGGNHDTTFDQMDKYYKKIYPQLIEQLEKEAPIDKKSKK